MPWQRQIRRATLYAVATLLRGGLTEHEVAQALALPRGSISRYKRYLRQMGIQGWREGTPHFPVRYTPAHIRAVHTLYAAGVTPTLICQQTGVPRGSLHRLLHQEVGVPIQVRPRGRPRGPLCPTRKW